MAYQINGFYASHLKPSETVGGCIEIYENAWPNSQEIVYKIENEINDIDSKIYWQKAPTIGAGINQKTRTNYLLDVSGLAKSEDNFLLQSLHNTFYSILLSTTNSYAERFKMDGLLYHEPYSLLKYSVNEEYKGHYDGHTETGRAISAICYMNDDYEGGSLEFPFFKLKIKPQAGMLILFPSNFAYHHIAHPITNGSKYAMVTWIKDRIINEK